MPGIVASFVVGFLMAQSGWWIAARGVIDPENTAALGGAPIVRFVLLAGVEILVAAFAFTAVLALVAQGRALVASRKGIFVAVLAGAVTATVAAGPFALIPPIIAGENMLFVYIVAGGLLSAAFALLVGRAFRGEIVQEA